MKLLTGRAKEDYRNWAWEQYFSLTDDDFSNYFINSCDVFELPLVMEWLDSVEIYIGVLICIDCTFDSYILHNDKRTECTQFQDSRTKAIKIAIEKANEIYNSVEKE